jgi:hypothetical protein
MFEVQYHFVEGQKVRLLRGDENLGLCTIEALLPAVGAMPMYQVRSNSNGFQRIVPEADLFPPADNDQFPAARRG